MLPRLRRVLKKPLKVLGAYTQVLPNNWKLYMDNVKDTYHASLLHVFFTRFRINRLTQKGGVFVSRDGAHHCTYTEMVEDTGDAYEKDGMRSAGSEKDFKLENPEMLEQVDELGELTFQELDDRGTALADSFRDLGVRPGDGVAVMVRNHRGFVDATLAAAKLGADLLYLNTAFAAPQLVEVLDRERPALLVHDEEFAQLAAGVGESVQRVVAWSDSGPVDVSTPPKLASARLEGTPSITLFVSDGGNGIDCDHANWAEPSFVLR